MARVTIAASAATDSAAILHDLNAKAGLPTVVKFRTLFRNLYDRLADHPASGAPRPALGPDIRIGIVSPYIVIYQHSQGSDTVTVLRIVAAAAGSPAECSPMLDDAKTAAGLAAVGRPAPASRPLPPRTAISGACRINR